MLTSTTDVIANKDESEPVNDISTQKTSVTVSLSDFSTDPAKWKINTHLIHHVAQNVPPQNFESNLKSMS